MTKVGLMTGGGSGKDRETEESSKISALVVFCIRRDG